MSDIFGKILGIVLVFLLCVLAPISIIVLTDDMTDRRNIFNEMTNFVDTVIDSDKISEAQLRDFYYGVSSYGPQCSVEIVQYIRVVTPGAQEGEAKISYVPVNITTQAETDVTLTTGDIVKVHVHATSYTGVQQFVHATIGMLLHPIDFTVSGKVR